MKKTMKIIGAVLLALAIFICIVLVILTVMEYRPQERETVTTVHSGEKELCTGDTINIVSWNCGYGALGDNADFFMDGGKGVYTSDKERVLGNLDSITKKLKEYDPDIVLAQEVDVNSSRSYGIDERDIIVTAMDDPCTAFAYNYNSIYVPLPVPPIGHVESGLFTMSRFNMDSAERIALPCPFSWPLRTINLKRCLLVSRIPVKDSDRELVLVNLHLEAYDSGAGKEEQTKLLAAFLQQEVEKGNYVIAGGDFNQIFSDIESPYPVFEGKWQPGLIDTSAFSDNLLSIMDVSSPSCRSLDRAYAGEAREDFQVYVIDGFLISKNITVNSMETDDLDFINSDHNPLRLSVTLRN